MNIQSLQEELHLKDYLDVLRRRRDVAVTFFAATVIVVVLGSFIVRPLYRATATMLIDLESPNVLTTTGMVELQQQNYYAYKEYFQSQVEIITSYGLAKKVFEEFGLGDKPGYRRAKEPVKKFMKTIKVEPVRDTRLLRLSVENRDPELAARMTNRLAQLYVMRNLYYISKNELMNLFKNEYLKLEAKDSELAKVYKGGHPEMVKLKEEMAELSKKIEQEKQSQFNYTDIETYLGKDSQHTLAGLKANNISIQDPAEKPVIPVSPKRGLNFVLSLLVGVFGGIGLAFFLEYLDDSARTVEDIERVVKWPFLGNVPDIGSKDDLKEFEKDIFVHTKPKDPIAEVYRIVRTRIIFSSTEERPLKSVLVTSPGPQEGKTMTLCNLGIALAQNQKRVLLVDADMRKPRLHEVFKRANDTGLSNYLAGQSDFKDCIQKTDIENLSLTAGGILPPNPSELLAGHRMKDFITKAKADFDFILFDSPPVAMVTDAVIISRAVDGTIVVIESGKTSKSILSRIHQLLDDTKARVVGMILNKVSLNSGSYYYYSSYYGKAK